MTKVKIWVLIQILKNRFEEETEEDMIKVRIRTVKKILLFWSRWKEKKRRNELIPYNDCFYRNMYRCNL